MKVYNNITEVYGNTPLVKLNKIMTNSTAKVLAKLEFYNPTSTVKDRLSIAMVDAAEKSGDRKSTRLNSSHVSESRMPSSA